MLFKYRSNAILLNLTLYHTYYIYRYNKDYHHRLVNSTSESDQNRELANTSSKVCFYML